MIDPNEVLTLSSVARDWGQIIITGIGLIWGYAMLTAKVREIVKDLGDHKTTHKEYCEGQIKELEDLESRVGFRMTSLETSQSKLQELIYRQMEALANKLEGVSDLINDVKSSQKETEGYLRAKKEMESPPRGSHR